MRREGADGKDRRLMEKSLPILRAMEHTKNENLIATHAIDHQPLIEWQRHGDAAEFMEPRRGSFAASSGAGKGLQQRCGLIDRVEEAVRDSWAGFGGEAVPSPINLTKSCS